MSEEQQEQVVESMPKGITAMRESAGKRKLKEPVDIPLFGAVVRFREPMVDDLAIDPERLKRIKQNYPTIASSRRMEIAVMASCYIPDPKEGPVNRDDQFAGFAADNDMAFAELAQKFQEAFPEFLGWLTAKAEAKNDSGQPTDPSEENSYTTL